MSVPETRGGSLELMCICVHSMHIAAPCLPLRGVRVFSCLLVSSGNHICRSRRISTQRECWWLQLPRRPNLLLSPPPSLQGQTPRHPLAHSSAVLLGSSFVTTLAGWLGQHTQWSKINTPIVESSRFYSSAPSIPRYMSPSFVCLWRFHAFFTLLCLKNDISDKWLQSIDNS